MFRVLGIYNFGLSRGIVKNVLVKIMSDVAVTIQELSLQLKYCPKPIVL
jgi:hypothetical protein